MECWGGSSHGSQNGACGAHSKQDVTAQTGVLSLRKKIYLPARNI